MKITRFLLTISVLASGTAMANVPAVPEGARHDVQADAARMSNLPAASFSHVHTGQMREFIVAGDAPCNPKVTVCDD